jgi:hypothetical protein
LRRARTTSNTGLRTVSAADPATSAADSAGFDRAALDARKRVPMLTRTSPSINAAASPRPSAMPPAATTGIGVTRSTTDGTSPIVARSAARARLHRALRHDHVGSGFDCEIDLGRGLDVADQKGIGRADAVDVRAGSPKDSWIAGGRASRARSGGRGRRSSAKVMNPTPTRAPHRARGRASAGRRTRHRSARTRRPRTPPQRGARRRCRPSVPGGWGGRCRAAQ